MDKASENTNKQVAVAPVVILEEKSGNNWKREAAEALEKTISAKKQKVEAEVEKVQVPPPEEEESTSTEEDTYSESEEEENVASKVIEKESNGKEEDDSADENSNKEPKTEKTPKTPIGNQSEREVTTIFVENLPSKVDEDDIAAFFKEAGEIIQVRLPKYGHVEFATEEAAKNALEMNRQEFMGRELRLQVAKRNLSSTHSRKDNSSNHKGEDENTDLVMKDAHSAKSDGKAKSDKKEMQPKTPIGNKNVGGATTIFVGNLPLEADKDKLAAFFKEAGEVIEVRMARKNRHSRYSHVVFATEEAAKKALEMNWQEFMGHELRLDLAKPNVASIRELRHDLAKPKVSSTHYSSGRGDCRGHSSGMSRGGGRGRGSGRRGGGRGRTRY